MENSSILNKLMSDNSDPINTLEDTSSSDKDKFATASRIVQVRYRFYAVWVLLLVLIAVFWFLMPSIDTYKAKKSQIQSARVSLAGLEARDNQYNQSIWFLETVKKEDSKIVDCINKWENCDSLPEEVKANTWLARAYLLTNGMNETKMDVDERKILESIDTYLVKLEPFLNNSSVNGTIYRISIWDKSNDGGLYSVPVQIDITFDDKSYLLSFINNIEKYIPEDDSVRIMYKIEKVSYDIINSDEAQDTSIYMTLYYYDE